MKLDPVIAKFEDRRDMIRVFGLILYTDRHANIAKVLADDAYWRGFDELTGQRWVVFSARPKEGHSESPDFGGNAGMMYSIWVEPNENKQLLETFVLRNTCNMPLFIAFTPLKTGEYLQASVRLTDDTMDNARNRIGLVLDEITKVLDKISEQNFRNDKEIFALVNAQVDRIKVTDGIGKLVGFYDWCRRFV